MKRSPLHLLIVFCFICTLLLPIPANALQNVDITRDCSLTIQYTKNGYAFPGLEIRIYQVAEFLSDYYYAQTDAFKNYPVRIHGVTSQKEWRDTANTLAAYIASDQLQPTKTALTDSDGTAAFTQLQTGLYLILGVSAENSSGSYEFENFMVFLPNSEENNRLNYDVVAKPKASFKPKPEEELLQYRVVKLWKDLGNSLQRPQSVTVAILKDGILQEEVSLHAGNNWSYFWTAPSDDSQWTVIEKNVPDGYSVIITASENTFSITNSRPAPGGAPPQMGDTFPLMGYILIMSFSGLLLTMLGIWRKRKAV